MTASRLTPAELGALHAKWKDARTPSENRRFMFEGVPALFAHAAALEAELAAAAARNSEWVQAAVADKEAAQGRVAELEAALREIHKAAERNGEDLNAYWVDDKASAALKGAADAAR